MHGSKLHTKVEFQKRNLLKIRKYVVLKFRAICFLRIASSKILCKLLKIIEVAKNEKVVWCQLL